MVAAKDVKARSREVHQGRSSAIGPHLASLNRVAMVHARCLEYPVAFLPCSLRMCGERAGKTFGKKVGEKDRMNCMRCLTMKEMAVVTSYI